MNIVFFFCYFFNWLKITLKTPRPELLSFIHAFVFEVVIELFTDIILIHEVSLLVIICYKNVYYLVFIMQIAKGRSKFTVNFELNLSF